MKSYQSMQRLPPKFENIKNELEEILSSIVESAKSYYRGDEYGYFNWLQRAGTLKMRAPQIPLSELTPEMMSRPLGQVLRQKTLKK